MDELEQIKLTFFQECDELLADLESGLLAMEAGEGDSETVNAVFRAVHSVKGGAGAFALEALVRYAHVFETLLDDVRSNKIAASPELVRVLLRAADILADQVTAARTGGVPDEAATAAMVGELEGWINGQGGAAAPAPTQESPAGAPSAPTDELGIGFTPMTISIDDFAAEPTAAAPAAPTDELGIGFTPMQLDLAEFDAPAEEAPAGEQAWIITFHPHAALYAKANETALLLRELERLGPIEVSIDDSELVSLEHLDPESAYLSWIVRLTTDVAEEVIRDVFEFVSDDCELTIVREGQEEVAEPAAEAAPVDDVAALIAQINAEPVVAAPAQDEILPTVAAAPVVAAPAPVTPEPVVQAATPAAPAPAAAKAAPPKAAANEPAQPQATIRVDPERIDRLIDLVGELVINQAMLAQRVGEHGFAPSSDIAMGLDELEQLTRGIQDSVMAIRAQPVKSVFQRMPRLVREVANQTGKQVRLVMEGEGTEVDKTVIERLSDPITHMLRNAIDHGLESPEDRVAAGKNGEGTVRLAALHRGGRIVIEVQDDGRGINRGRVRQIAIDKGLISPDAVLTDEETDNLIFLPGFSTAAKVSDISGRGVGMDVVRRSVQALGGRISISSRPGEGSIFTLSLPLTLAVLDGMVIDVAGHTLVVPLTAIIESLRPKSEEIKALGPQGSVLAVRDTYVPLVDVGSVLGFRNDLMPATDGVVLLVENEDGGRAGLVADAIQGQRQVVIKSLESNYRQVDGIAAATILGDGRVALILDVDAVVALRRREPRAPEPILHAAE
ncbi:MAG: chemotaxis protein CheA [Proteobacteria bacterium]|nr:chemotaxis protein CheA [Pseudomonadota bacterium]